MQVPTINSQYLYGPLLKIWDISQVKHEPTENPNKMNHA